jgi:amino-acid N-acetyltransferase
MSQATPAVRAGTEHDHAAVIALLEAASLPTAGVPATLADYLVADAGGEIVGVIGLEPYGRAALLRSAAVDPVCRGAGIGGKLVQGILEQARRRGVREMFLLTTTAEDYFPRFGFQFVPREEVPLSVRQSVEFREACPASAVAMRRALS